MSDSNDDAAAAANLPEISPSELASHVDRSDAFVLDLRRGTRGKQIYGAIQYDPKKLLEASKLAIPLPKKDGLIVLYDERGDSHVLGEIAEKFRVEGFADTRALRGGFAAYEAAGLKLEEITMEQPVPLVSEHQLER